MHSAVAAVPSTPKSEAGASGLSDGSRQSGSSTSSTTSSCRPRRGSASKGVCNAKASTSVSVAEITTRQPTAAVAQMKMLESVTSRAICGPTVAATAAEYVSVPVCTHAAPMSKKDHALSSPKRSSSATPSPSASLEDRPLSDSRSMPAGRQSAPNPAMFLMRFRDVWTTEEVLAAALEVAAAGIVAGGRGRAAVF